VLTEFRARLLADGQAERLLTLMLDRLRERGLLHGGGRQRTDATHVRMAVRDLHRLQAGHRDPPRRVGGPGGGGAELAGRADPARVGATLRPARRRLAAAKAEHARTERAVEVGRDGLVLLEAVYAPDAPAGLAGVEAVQVLRATWIQQFYLDDGRVRWRDKHSGLPPGSRIILNPYDLDARPGVKRGRTWRGYKAHLHRDL
jgi:hypothetical protein